MGQTLSEPIIDKQTIYEKNNDVYVGASSMQGWRINMEDAHTHLLSTEEDNEASFYAVYDGHGGAKVAKYAEKYLHKKILKDIAYKSGHIEESIKKGFLALDEDMLQDDEYKEELSGSTAICALIKDKTIYCGNVGDSRAVISNNGIAEPLSLDHKPANEAESRRIVAAGGFVEFNRVNGNLALSRALGDFVFKKNDRMSPQEQIVTAYPDVTVKRITKDVEFLVLACDGIWDVLSSQEVIDFIRTGLAEKKAPEIVCEELMTRCLAPDCQMGGLGCDNMTVLLVCFLNGASFEELSKRCCRPKDSAGDTG